MTNTPLDFSKVETLRKHMLLSTSDMATLFGVSRMTYYGWTRGKKLRVKNDATVRRVLKQLLWVMTEHNWPTPEVIVADQKVRLQHLQQLIG